MPSVAVRVKAFKPISFEVRNQAICFCVVRVGLAPTPLSFTCTTYVVNSYRLQTVIKSSARAKFSLFIVVFCLSIQPPDYVRKAEDGCVDICFYDWLYFGTGTSSSVWLTLGISQSTLFATLFPGGVALHR